MHSHDEGKDRLKTLVAQSQPASPQLPLVHSTDVYALGDALVKGDLVPESCDVFLGEHLIYTFYGRPSYRPNTDEPAASLEHYLPVCLIFKTSLAADIRRIFPFDSGAFVDDYYRRFLHKAMKLGDFALEADLSTPGRVVTTFFGSAKNYLLGQSDRDARFDAAQFEARSYAALIDAKDSNAGDSRGSSIEVQFDRTISLGDWVEAAVIPSSFVDSETGDALKRLNITTLPYNVHNRFKPNEYTSTVTDLCLAYYAQKGLLPEMGR
ncbi:hypothetical protein GCM10010520_51560 [Rhizobium viscosum]|uniref:Uncharacterized protein n=1 Tax=Rhizobium viscosum TaxID=1673 RepID=A0ABR9IZ92_RHIVS|nr:hypothetical protein [Rhizobium viscosum]MBE1508528.1 hypothetical protein [Rhizobium viscosum]